jgi:hypothetical protein
MKISALFLCFVGCLALNAQSSAGAAPSSARAYCAKHRSFYSGEVSADELPADVRAAGGTYWRCESGRAMVCQGGASGFACLRTERMDARRMRAFVQFCSENPNSDYIPNALSAGLASEWRCSGTRPVRTKTIPVDSRGYFKDSWRVLR